MSDSGKDTVAPKEKDGAEKRGRGRPRKHPQVVHCFTWGVVVLNGSVVLLNLVKRLTDRLCQDLCFGASSTPLQTLDMCNGHL
uniref:Uncharacterized protein n=1 Tax=Cyprinus carpio TaxID=7962 RepID=A0A8C1UMB0_CYPCA